MIITYTRRAVPMLIGIAFGIFFAVSCGTFKTTEVNNAEEAFNGGNYAEARENIDRQIRNNPDDSEAIILKLKILKELAENTKPVKNRASLFHEMAETAGIFQITEAASSYTERADSILQQAWNNEQQAGIKLLQQDQSGEYKQYFDEIVNHFRNALVLRQDNETTYNLLATTYYRHGDVDKAIETINEASGYISELSDELNSKLAYLNLESGNIAEAIEIYERLLNSDPGNKNYQHGLVNSYILGHHHDESIRILEKLVDSGIDDNAYREALASELLFKFNEDLENRLSVESAENVSVSQLTEVYNKVEKLNSERNPRQEADFESNYAIAGLYKNSAKNLFLLAGVIADKDSSKAGQLKLLGKNFLHSSLHYWEKLVNEYPDNPDIVKNLYQVYIELEMNENAESIRSNYNF